MRPGPTSSPASRRIRPKVTTWRTKPPSSCAGCDSARLLDERDEGLVARARLVRNFGFAGYDEVVCLGINGKMSEASAAMALTSLESLDEFLAANRRNYDVYREALAGLPGVGLLAPGAGDGWNHHYVALEIDPPVAGLDRDHVLSVLWAERIFARRYFHPGCHRMEPYRSYYPHAGLMLPVTERVAARVMLLPTGTAIGPADIRTICQILRFAVTHGADVTQMLRSSRPPGMVTR